MAKLNNPQGKPTSPRTMTPEERQKLAQSQARARSMARAQAVARAQANARAQARVRLAALADEGEDITVGCQFCDAAYVFTPAEIEELLKNI